MELHHVQVSAVVNNLQLSFYRENGESNSITFLHWDNALHRINELIIDGIASTDLEKFDLNETHKIEKAIYDSLFRQQVEIQQKDLNLSVEEIADLTFLLILQIQAQQGPAFEFYNSLNFSTAEELKQFIRVYKETYPNSQTILARLKQLFAGEAGTRQTIYLLWQIAKASITGLLEADLKRCFSLINDETITFLFKEVNVSDKLPVILARYLQQAINSKKITIQSQIIHRLSCWKNENQRFNSTAIMQQGTANPPLYQSALSVQASHYQSERLVMPESSVKEQTLSASRQNLNRLFAYVSAGAVGLLGLGGGFVGFLLSKRYRAHRFRETATAAVLQSLLNKPETIQAQTIQEQKSYFSLAKTYQNKRYTRICKRQTSYTNSKATNDGYFKWASVATNFDLQGTLALLTVSLLKLTQEQLPQFRSQHTISFSEACIYAAVIAKKLEYLVKSAAILLPTARREKRQREDWPEASLLKQLRSALIQGNPLDKMISDYIDNVYSGQLNEPSKRRILAYLLAAQASRYAHEKFWPSCPQN